MDATRDTDRQPDASTDQPTDDDLEVQFLTFGPGYRVTNGDGGEHVVDVEQETCNCDGHCENGGPCVHLNRAKQAINSGELPGPDGHYVR